MLCPICLKEVGFPDNEKDDSIVVLIVNGCTRIHYHKPCFKHFLARKHQADADWALHLRERWNGGAVC